MTRHKHFEVIKAWAEGAEIQYRRYKEEQWLDAAHPCFNAEFEYRVKPRTVKREGWVNIYHICSVHATEEIAKKFSEEDDIVATVKVEWEEEE